jgi:hypothetical protein
VNNARVYDEVAAGVVVKAAGATISNAFSFRGIGKVARDPSATGDKFGGFFFLGLTLDSAAVEVETVEGNASDVEKKAAPTLGCFPHNT